MARGHSNGFTIKKKKRIRNNNIYLGGDAEHETVGVADSLLSKVT